MSRLVFLDTETTGLLPYFHEVWEIAILERKTIQHDAQPAQVVDTEHLFHVRPDLSKADPTGLRVSRFYERTKALDAYPRDSFRMEGGNLRTLIPGKGWDCASEVAAKVARLLDGAHIVGAVPSFDAAFLSRFLYRHGQAATWHYHLIDVEALAVGYFAAAGAAPALPWSSDVLAVDLGVTVQDDARHTALGDARWARDIYDRVMGSAVR